MPTQPECIGAGLAKLVERGRAVRVPRAEQPDVVAAAAGEFLVAGQPRQANAPAAERAFQRCPARRAVAASGPGPGQQPHLDRGQHLVRFADFQQGPEGGITRLGQVSQRGPGQLLPR